MIHSIKTKLVNWQDCMNISASHFMQTEDYFINSIRDAVSHHLNNHNFGLLPTRGVVQQSDGIRISEHPSGHIEIRLMHCNAVTQSGIRINYNPGAEKFLIQNYDPKKHTARGRDSAIQLWDIILVVDPFKRIPTGVPDVDEMPPRHPDAESAYSLVVIPSGEVDTIEFGQHHLIIGRIRKKSDQYEVDGNYIPPCSSMNSHEELIEYHNKFGHQLMDIEKSSKSIIGKIYSRSNETRLAENIKYICNDVLRYLAEIYFNYRNLAIHEAPIKTVNYASSLAHIIYISINTLSGPDKEELLNYFYEWSDVTPGSFEDMLAQSMQILYEHGNIRVTMLELDILLSTLSDLWKKLNRLEYIGQHKESVVVSERAQFTAPTHRKGNDYSIFD